MIDKKCKNCIWNYDPDVKEFCDEQRKNGFNPCDRHVLFDGFIDGDDPISIKDIEDIIDKGEK